MSSLAARCDQIEGRLNQFDNGAKRLTEVVDTLRQDVSVQSQRIQDTNNKFSRSLEDFGEKLTIEFERINTAERSMKEDFQNRTAALINELNVFAERKAEEGVTLVGHLKTKFAELQDSLSGLRNTDFGSLHALVKNLADSSERQNTELMNRVIALENNRGGAGGHLGNTGYPNILDAKAIRDIATLCEKWKGVADRGNPKDPRHWIKKVKTVLEKQGVLDSFHAVIPFIMEGKAETWFHTLETHEIGTWEDFSRAFLSRYHESDDPHYAFRQLSTIRESSYTSWAEFTSVFKDTVSKARSRDARVNVSFFLEALANEDIRKELRITIAKNQKRGKDMLLSDAIDLADTLRLAHSKEVLMSTSSGEAAMPRTPLTSGPGGAEPMVLDRLQAMHASGLGSSVSDQLRKLQEQVERLATMQSSRGRGDTRTCYNCNEPGHISTDCPLPDKRRSRPTGDDKDRRWRTPSRPGDDKGRWRTPSRPGRPGDYTEERRPRTPKPDERRFRTPSRGREERPQTPRK